MLFFKLLNCEHELDNKKTSYRNLEKDVDKLEQENKKLNDKIKKLEKDRREEKGKESVVTDGGGRNAYIDGYRIGGKTGTAQKAVNGSYVGGGYILSFVGIAPIDDPQIVLYIAMDNPKNLSLIHI